MYRNTLLERLTWLATAERGAQADWLPNNDWHTGIGEVAVAALDAIPSWRPIAEAPIPGPDAVGEYWTLPCLLQTTGGIVGEGFARYVTDNRVRGRKHVNVLRWYMGAADRPTYTRVCPDPKYFMPLPAKRED